jgi:hypothetical protein
MGEIRNPLKIVVEKHYERRSLVRHRHRLEDTIEMYVKRIGEGVDLIKVAQGRGKWRIVLLECCYGKQNCLKFKVF